jgi:hypothetical protein
VCTLIISALSKLREEGSGFQVRLGYITRPCLNRKKQMELIPFFTAMWSSQKELSSFRRGN